MNKKTMFTILIVLGLIIIFTGGTYAYLSWTSNSDDNTNVTFTKGEGFSCSADGGGNITTGEVSLMPTDCTKNSSHVIKREITVNPSITDINMPIYMNLWLNVNSMGTGLSNSSNLKYSLTTSSTNCETDVVSTGTFTGKTAGDKVTILSGNTYTSTTTETYYLYIWLDKEETSSDTINQSFSLSLGGSCYNKMPITATTLASKANPSTLMYADATDSQKAEMWTFSHEATEQLEATTDYRYIGSSPNNYITYNDEVWRIIGVFDGRIKIIKDTSIGSMSWDYKKSGVGSSIADYGSNDWSDSQLMYMLNPTSYKLKDGYSSDGTYIYDGSGNIIYQLGCKPASIASGATSYSCTTNTWTLNSTALSQISEVTYYLGGTVYDSDSQYGTAEEIYTWERGKKVYNGRPTKWTGLVGLMYPSDYAYTFANGVDDTCYSVTKKCSSYDGGNPNSSWLYKSGTYQWTVSPYSDSRITYEVFDVYYNGQVDTYQVRYGSGVRPVLYLRSGIKLQGSGGSDDPYEIIE